MQYIDVINQNIDIGTCHRIEKSDKKTSSQKIIAWFDNRKYCKKKLISRRKLININRKSKYNFGKNNEIFIDENLTRTN